MKHKKIGVLVCEIEGMYQGKLATGINRRAKILGYDVLYFSNFVKDSTYKFFQHGEMNIFRLVNFEKLDGVIVVSDSFKADEETKKYIYNQIKDKCNCPVVIIDDFNESYDNVVVNDELPFESLTDHLIEEHNCKDILFLSGSYETTSTQIRLAGYKKSLESHNIPVRDELICFDGEFWYDGGAKIAKKIIDGEMPRPQAIACCGDYMAIGAIEEFKRQGYKIPEDIIIVGYDAVDEALKCVPSVTTCEPPVSDAGENAVIDIDCRIKGVKPQGFVSRKGNLKLGDSCGCHSKVAHLRYENSEVVDNFTIFSQTNMLEGLTESENFPDVLMKIEFILYLIANWKNYYLCLCENWLNSAYENDEYFCDGYTQKMTKYIRSENKKVRSVCEEFDVSEMLPEIFHDKDEPEVYYFTPVHLNKKCFGYSVICFETEKFGMDKTYQNWCKYVNVALGSVRMMNELSYMSMRDALTGIYTRIGIAQNMSGVIGEIDNRENRMFVLVADLNRLKKINDSYGHQEGDVAIRITSQAISNTTQNSELCARIGGDEFVVIGCGKYSDDYGERFINRVNDILEKINKEDLYPYPITASMGAVIERIEKVEDIDRLFNEADKLMYENKKKQHQLRID